jgi:hypothetical protein
MQFTVNTNWLNSIIKNITVPKEAVLGFAIRMMLFISHRRGSMSCRWLTGALLCACHLRTLTFFPLENNRLEWWNQRYPLTKRWYSRSRNRRPYRNHNCCPRTLREKPYFDQSRKRTCAHSIDSWCASRCDMVRMEDELLNYESLRKTGTFIFTDRTDGKTKM